MVLFFLVAVVCRTESWFPMLQKTQFYEHLASYSVTEQQEFVESWKASHVWNTNMF